MVSPGFYQRLKDLEDNIAQDLELLKKYEEALRYTEEPFQIVKYRRRIKQQRESVNSYQIEYVELKEELADATSTEMQNLGKQLKTLDDKLNILLSSQFAIYEDINQTRQALLDRYDATEQVIIAAIAQQLDENQLVMTQRLIEAVEANQISQPQMQQMLAVIEDIIPSLPPSQATVLEVIKDPALDARHKLKVTLPILPLIVNYESELELGAGFNIKSAWEKLVNKLRRE